VHVTSSPIDWYVARAGGVAAYVLLSAVVALGLSMARNRTYRLWPRFALEDVHRFGGLLVGSFVAIHVAAVAADSYLPFSIASLIIPFTSRYRPLWIALGVVAAELLLALAVTNHYRHRALSHRFWRRAHYVNFVVWCAATLHGLGSGTDRSTPWLLAIYAVAVAVVLGLTAGRFLHLRPGAPLLRRLVPPVVALAGVVVVTTAASGPLKFRPRPWNAATFNDVLTGQVQRDTGVTRGIVSVAGTGSGEQRVLLRADLLIAPNRLVSTTFQMEYLPSGLLCRGRVTRVESLGFDATCRTASGGRRLAHAAWRPAFGPTLVGGTLRVHPAPTSDARTGTGAARSARSPTEGP
jgi:methionine sulfoxide reductase heme-binding subunit